MTEDITTASKKKKILNYTMRLTAVLTVLILVKLFPRQIGQIIGWMTAAGFVVYCCLPKPPKTKNSHTITVKRG